MVRSITIILIISFFHAVTADSKQLTDILHILATEHPEAKSLFLSSSAHKAHADASGILPDPKIGFAYRNYPTKYGYALNDRELNTPTMTGMEFSVAQEFPYPGKLGTEIKVAHYQHSQANLIYLDGINFLASEMLLELNKSRKTHERMEINDRIIVLLNAQKSIVDGYYSSGMAPQTQLLKAAIVKTEALSRNIEYKTQARESEARIGYFLLPEKISRKDLNQLDLDAYLELSQKYFLELSEKKSATIESSPKYLIFAEDEKRLKEQAHLTKFNIAPQTEVFFSYMKRRPQTFALDQGPLDVRFMDVTEYRGDLFSFGLNMRVPVWSALNWDSITEETEQNAKAGVISKERVIIQLTSEFDKGISTINGTREQIEILEKNLIPQLEKSVTASMSLYGPGKANLQESILSKVEVLNAKIKLIELQEKRNEAILELLRLIGKIYPEFDPHSHQTMSMRNGGL
jgi:outer membrane protein TolC